MCRYNVWWGVGEEGEKMGETVQIREGKWIYREKKAEMDVYVGVKIDF